MFIVRPSVNNHFNFSFQQLHLALYSHNAGLVSAALKLMYRARYLALIVFGEGHPDMATFDVRYILYDFVT